MAYTRHGHHIPNTVELDLPPGKDCGGIELCEQCKNDASEVTLELARLAWRLYSRNQEVIALRKKKQVL